MGIMKILPLVCTALLASSFTARAGDIDVDKAISPAAGYPSYNADNVTVDSANLNIGNFGNHRLNFGLGSGEGIGSKRNAGPGQYGLDFYTGFQQRMTLDNNGALSLTPATGGSLTARGLSINQSSSSSGPPPGNWAFNEIQITDSTSYATNVFVSGLHIGYGFGGPSATGGRLAFDSSLTLTSPTSSANTNRNYVAGNFQAAANSGDGGAAPTLFNAKGSIFAITPTIRARNGATNLEQISGMEIDINAEAGSSMRWKNGIIVNYNENDYVGGTEIDNMISLCRYNGPGTGTLSTTLGAKVGIEFGYGDGGGDPMRTNGTLIKATSSSNPTVQTGIDFYDYNITGNLIQGKYSALGDTGGLFIGAGLFGTVTNVVAQGGQANVDINIASKGAGLIKVGNAQNFTTGSHTTVAKWLKVKDENGTVYYMPLYQ
jgi:hypothetical protein